MLTYEAIAKQIKVPVGTLRRKVIEFNAVTRDCDKVKPDKIEGHEYLFNASTVPKIQAAIRAVRQKPVGRPRKEKSPITKGKP